MSETPDTWPEQMDALIAAPEHHRLALENDFVRVLETKIEPGETVPMHTHCWPSAMYVLSWSDFIRRNERGAVVLDSRQSGLDFQPGQAIWSQPLDLHTLENVGDRSLHVISVEVKPPTP